LIDWASDSLRKFSVSGWSC